MLSDFIDGNFGKSYELEIANGPLAKGKSLEIHKTTVFFKSVAFLLNSLTVVAQASNCI